MPLPRDDQDWPPTRIEAAYDLMDLHDAWYVGDPDVLQTAYRNRPYKNHPAQYKGGIVGFTARLWWGKPTPAGQSRVKLHLPLPADVSTMSADLLFSEPPRFVLPDASKTAADGTIVKSKEQEAIEAVVNVPEVHTALLEGAEVASALGGAFVRLIWDRERMDHVRIDAVHADNAVPSFRSSILHDVLFWTQVSDHDDARVLRHVELHEKGKITHALYAGTTDSIGNQVPFTEAPEEALQWLVDLKGDGVTGTDREKVLATGVDGLTACYIPNQRPNRAFRKNAYLSQFGRSDYAGLEPAFDAIDEAWSSWARDVRLAKARIIVPTQYLESQGPGDGARFDTEAEVYEGLDFLTSDPGSRSITPQQFAIRVEEHRSTITEWTRYVLRGAGYSPSSLGEQGMSVQRTATEVSAEERLSDRTRDKKINYWKAGLRQFVKTWMDLEARFYSGPTLQELPEIRFPSESQQDPRETAEIASMLASSQSASIMTRVRSMHPEWDGETVNQEVDRIKEELGIGGMPMPDGAAYKGILADAMNQPMGAEEAAELKRKAAERAGEDEEA